MHHFAFKLFIYPVDTNQRPQYLSLSKNRRKRARTFIAHRREPSLSPLPRPFHSHHTAAPFLIGMLPLSDISRFSPYYPSDYTAIILSSADGATLLDNVALRVRVVRPWKTGEKDFSPLGSRQFHLHGFFHSKSNLRKKFTSALKIFS